MKIKPGILFTAIVLTTTVNAATYNVTRTDDPAPDGCKQNDCSLREAVIEANQTEVKDNIMLPAGVYLLDIEGSDTSEDGDLDISTDMEFVGSPSSIDGQNLSRIMDIRSDANVTLRDVTLQNAYYQYNGGALVVNGGSLTLKSVTFDSNNGGGLGGAIYAAEDAVVDIDDSLFTNNNGGSGAAIYTSDNITIRNTVFRSNNANHRGGAVYVAGSTSKLVLENVTLDQNTSATSAGALLFLGRQLIIDGLIATANEAAGGDGGVLLVTGTSQAKTIEIINTLFKDNLAEDGGAISFGGSSDTIDMRHNSFVSNTATGAGGAIYLTGGETDLTNNTFSDNQAGSRGGAIYLYGTGLTIHHATISGGSASSGTALYLGGTSSISSVELANNLIDGGCDIFNSDILTSLGGNVEGTGDSCGLDAGSDLVNQSNAQLGLEPLSGNSSNTPTHKLTTNSVARGQGEPAICELVKIDQLFQHRGNPCNSGADESDTIFADSFEPGKNGT